MRRPAGRIRGYRARGWRAARPGALVALLFVLGSCGSPTDAPSVARVLVSASDSQLLVGETSQLSARLEDDGGNLLTGRTVHWTSGNTTIATVSGGGLVEAKSTGSVTITAASEGHEGTTLINVVAPVSTVEVDPVEHTMPVGSSVQLSTRLRDANGSPLFGRTVEWSSSNNSVVSVSSNGRANALTAGGPVTITATVEGKLGTTLISIGNPCTTERSVAIGQSVTGSLASGDCAFEDGSYVDLWRLHIEAATTVQMRLDSDDFDAFLIVSTPQGDVVAFNDDGDLSGNSLLKTSLPAGEYVIWANSFDTRVTGRYTLSIASGSVTQCSAEGTIEFGQTVNGTLASGDCHLGDGTFADGWVLTVPGLTGIVADMSSVAFDAFLIITDGQGRVVAYDDDGGPGTNSRIEVTLPKATYWLWTNSFYPNQTGAYSLVLRSDACRSASTLPIGGSVIGTLATGDCIASDGSLADRWELDVPAASAVRLDLSSTAFDPYLLVTDTAGNVLAGDDDGGEGTSARIDIALAAGTYIVWANSYTPSGTGGYSLGASSGTAELDLHIDGLYVTQSIQRFGGTVPLVAGQPAFVRVFGRANATNTATPAVRVRVYDGAALVDSMTVAATGTSVTTALSEGTRDLSWNVVLDKSLVHPGLAIEAEIDPDGLIAEADESDNVYPAAAPKVIDVRTVPRFDLTLVPVIQSVNGLTGNVTTGNAGTYVDLVRRVYPMDSIDVAVRTPYTTTLPVLSPTDGNGSWGRLLGEIDALRLAEGGTRTYYGVLKLAYGSGIVGLGSLGRPTAIGADIASIVPWVTAHELGHTFGRLHAPCGGPGGPDPQYPYANGAIGQFGYDRADGHIVPRTAPDLMSYCDDTWISDYTYAGVLNFRQGAAAQTSSTASAASQPVLLVWGSIQDGAVTLEPAFHLVTRPTAPDESGPWALTARDETGAVLFTRSFAVTTAEGRAKPTETFALGVPADSALAARIRTLSVSGPAGSATRAVGAPSAASDRLAAALARAGDRLTATWDRGKYPAAMLRDRRTGQILSIVRDGRVSVPSRETNLELLLSDGVRTVRQAVRAP